MVCPKDAEVTSSAIGLQDFRNLLASIAPEVCCNDQVAVALYHALARGKEGVQFRDLAGGLVALSPVMPLHARLDTLFDLFDENRNGLIDPEELHSLMLMILGLMRPSADMKTLETEVKRICARDIKAERWDETEVTAKFRILSEQLKLPPHTVNYSISKKRTLLRQAVMKGDLDPGEEGCLSRAQFSDLVEHVPLFKDFLQLRVLKKCLNPSTSSSPSIHKMLGQGAGHSSTSQARRSREHGTLAEGERIDQEYLLSEVLTADLDRVAEDMAFEMELDVQGSDEIGGLSRTRSFTCHAVSPRMERRRSMQTPDFRKSLAH